MKFTPNTGVTRIHNMDHALVKWEGAGLPGLFLDLFRFIQQTDYAHSSSDTPSLFSHNALSPGVWCAAFWLVECLLQEESRPMGEDSSMALKEAAAHFQVAGSNCCRLGRRIQGILWSRMREHSESVTVKLYPCPYVCLTFSCIIDSKINMVSGKWLDSHKNRWCG